MQKVHAIMSHYDFSHYKKIFFQFDLAISKHFGFGYSSNFLLSCLVGDNMSRVVTMHNLL